MSHKRTCAALATLGLALLGGCDRDPAEPNREYMPDMASSMAFESFSPNPLTKDGRTMMAPPKGTVSRTQELYAYAPGPEEAARAARELENPVPETDLVHERGQIAFARWCSPCHGLTGQGDGPVTRLFPRPPSLLAPHAQDLADGQIFHVISWGQGLMRGYAQQIEPRDRWMILHHIRKMQYDAQVQAAQAAAAAQPAAPPPESPVPPEASPEPKP